MHVSPRHLCVTPPPPITTAALGRPTSQAHDGILTSGGSLECDKSAERRPRVLEAEFMVEKLLLNYCQL